MNIKVKSFYYLLCTILLHFSAQAAEPTMDSEITTKPRQKIATTEKELEALKKSLEEDEIIVETGCFSPTTNYGKDQTPPRYQVIKNPFSPIKK